MKKCSLCGEKALEGIEICPECLKKAAVDPKQIKRLRQISNILSITADTDTNIKACMQSITEIADDLERGSYGKEEKKQESNTIPTGKDIDISETGKRSTKKNHTAGNDIRRIYGVSERQKAAVGRKEKEHTGIILI